MKQEVPLLSVQVIQKISLTSYRRSDLSKLYSIKPYKVCIDLYIKLYNLVYVLSV